MLGRREPLDVAHLREEVTRATAKQPRGGFSEAAFARMQALAERLERASLDSPSASLQALLEYAIERVAPVSHQIDASYVLERLFEAHSRAARSRIQKQQLVSLLCRWGAMIFELVVHLTLSRADARQYRRAMRQLRSIERLLRQAKKPERFREMIAIIRKKQAARPKFLEALDQEHW